MSAPLLESVRALLAAFEADAPEVPDSPTQRDLAPWRERIDLLDRAVIYLLNERATCANTIGHIKRDLGLPVYVPSREADVLANVRATNPGPLPDAAVSRLYERVIDETRALEREHYGKADFSARKEVE
jgi:chorismate mutase